MYRVSKVLNNNGVIAIDMDENKEYVILGKGVGFGKKVSQRFDKPEGCTTYRLEQETERGSAESITSPILDTEPEDNQRIRLLANGEIKAGEPLFAVETLE